MGLPPTRSGADISREGERWLTLANAITSIRLPLAPLCAWAIVSDQPLLAASSFALAGLTDLVDGRVARHRGEVSRLGGVLDHTSDALFVASGLAALASQGIVPWALAPLVVLAFLQYALDSRVLAGQTLRTSQLGRFNGIGYFILLGTPLIRDALGLPWPGPGLVFVLGGLLVASTGVSMLDRGWAYWLSRRAPGSPDEGR